MQVIHYKVFHIRQILLYQLLQRILYQLYVTAHTIVSCVLLLERRFPPRP